MATFGQITSSTSIAAGQSIRRNAGDTAFEAYTPSSGGGEYTLLESITYNGSTALNIIGSTGWTTTVSLNSYRRLKVIFHIQHPTTTNAVPCIRFNSDTGANYYSARSINSSNTNYNGETYIRINVGGVDNAAGEVLITNVIATKPKGLRAVLNGMNTASVSASQAHGVIAGIWNNTTNLIDSIQIYSSNSGSNFNPTSGSYIEVWGAA